VNVTESGRERIGLRPEPKARNQLGSEDLGSAPSGCNPPAGHGPDRQPSYYIVTRAQVHRFLARRIAAVLPQSRIGDLG
jgi:hypothetical protein